MGLGKQCWPGAVWSRSELFAISSASFHHFVSQNNLSPWHWPSRYMAKSLDSALYEVNHCDTLVHYTVYDIHPSNSLQDIKQNPWTVKCRPLTYIYFVRLIFVSHWSIIPSMTFLHQIVLKILSKITGLQTIRRWLTYILWVQSLCHTDPLSQIWHSSVK